MLSASSISGGTSITAISIVRADDPSHHVASLENANFEHVAAVSHPLGRAVQRVAESLSQPAARIT